MSRDIWNSETMLWLENNEPLYRRRQEIERKIAERVCRTRYSDQHAIADFRQLVDEGARSYRREIGENLPVDERRSAARAMADEFRRRVAGIVAGDPASINDTEAATAELLRQCKERVARSRVMFDGARKGRAR